jgi:hypothetical protein
MGEALLVRIYGLTLRMAHSTAVLQVGQDTNGVVTTTLPGRQEALPERGGKHG